MSRANSVGTGIYSKDFNALSEFKMTANATAKHGDRIFYPADYSEQDFFIAIPADWAKYFPDQSIVDFVGIQMLPKYVNEIFLERPSDASSHQIVNGNFMSFTFSDPVQAAAFSHKNFEFNGQFKTIN